MNYFKCYSKLLKRYSKKIQLQYAPRITFEKAQRLMLLTVALSFSGCSKTDPIVSESQTVNGKDRTATNSTRGIISQ